MSSFDTFIGRPSAWCGEALRHAASTSGLAPSSKPAGLRTAQEFAAAVDDEIGAAREPWARPFEMLGGGVDHDRDAARLA